MTRETQLMKARLYVIIEDEYVTDMHINVPAQDFDKLPGPTTTGGGGSQWKKVGPITIFRGY